MKANELRIGNLLDVDGNFWKVNSIITNPFELYFDENQEYDHSLNAKPIPLTEEWLLKFGFEHAGTCDAFMDGHYSHKNLNRVYLDNNFQPAVIEERSFANHLTDYELIYVHQLQNLYFALTGEELEINGK